MDVTCDRCQTQYEFDDALVSEAGTSVRCTQCGFKFRVRREGSAAPELWVVRTVDGRELEFRALRDLKTSISTGRIGRDDVLSRGVGRPRRLASIAELEPFFATPGRTAVGLGDEPRPRSRTPHGLGPFVPPQAEPDPDRTENSVAFSLPKLAQEAAQASVREARRHREGMNTANYGTPLAPVLAPTGPESVEPDTARVARSKRATPRGLAPPPMADDDITEARALSTHRAAIAAAVPADPISLTGTTLGTGRRPSPYDDLDAATIATRPNGPRGGAAARPVTPAPVIAEAEPVDGSDALAATIPRTNGAAAHGPGERAASEIRPESETAPEPPAAPVASEPPPAPALGRTRKIADEELAKVSAPDRDSEPPAASRSAALPLPTGPSADDQVGVRAREDSHPPIKHTPTPAEVRFSISGDEGIGSDPRFTALSARPSGMASGSTRLIVGLLVLGALAFIGVLLVQKFVLAPTNKPPEKQDDSRDNARVGG